MKTPEIYLSNLLNRRVTAGEVASAVGYSRQHYAKLRDQGAIPFERMREALRGHFGLSEGQEVAALMEVGYLNRAAVIEAVRPDEEEPPSGPRRGPTPEQVNSRDFF